MHFAYVGISFCTFPALFTIKYTQRQKLSTTNFVAINFSKHDYVM